MQTKAEFVRTNYSWSGFNVALFILFLGIFWLGKDMGWIQVNVNIWPILLIALGSYWILSIIMRNFLR